MFAYSIPGQTQIQSCTCHVLAKNNEKTIGNCLHSAIAPGIFSKILILIDTKSADGTGTIIHDYAIRFPNIQILPYKWSKPPDFAAARNFAIQQSQTPYGFWLDSDEVLARPNEIGDMLSRAKGQAFNIWVISPIAGGSHDMYQPRLFPIFPGIHFDCPVFERLDWSLRRNGVEIENTTAEPIFHPGYMNQRELTRKNHRNMQIMRKYLRRRKTDDTARDHIIQQFNALR